MGIGTSIFLLATGAILSWGVEANPDGVNLDTIGAILMVVGGVGLLLSLLLFDDWRPWDRRHDYVDEPVTRHRDVYIDDEPAAHRSIVEEGPVVRRRVVDSRRFN